MSGPAPGLPARAAWGSLATRSRQPELMDGAGLGDAALQARVLADLARVNRVTRTHAPVLAFLRDAWQRLPPQQAVNVLDVGSGDGDLLRAVWHLARRLGRPVRLQGLDLQAHSTRAAQASTPPAMGIEFITGDLFAHRPVDTDFIVCSQLAHHLDDDQIVALLQWLQQHARQGWCVADLRRHWLPWLTFRWLARIAGWHPVVRLDGTLSIARSCTPAEWHSLVARAGAPAQVRRHVPFRLTVRSVPR